MAHFAKLDENNVVTEVIVLNNDVLLDANGDEQESLGVTFCSETFGGTWMQTSYNRSFRGKLAAVGDTYHADIDAFLLPQPYPSWVKSATLLRWEAPVALPNDGNSYSWDEDTMSWVQVEVTMP